MKSALAIHDLSCHAASSLNVVIPVLTASGVDLSFLPSALLSTQSDGFENLYARNLETDCFSILDRWAGYGLSFDSLYTGYLADKRQGELVMKARNEFLKDGALILTDPVMGDDGQLYQQLDEKHVALMKDLIKGSSVITPNWTEALLLTGRSGCEATSEGDAKAIAAALHDYSGAAVVITSIPLRTGLSVNLAYDGKEARIFSYEHIDASYPGSGDLFASLLLSFMLNEESFFVSVRKATNITSEAIARTAATKRERREGVCVHYAVRAMLREASFPLS